MPLISFMDLPWFDRIKLESKQQNFTTNLTTHIPLKT